MYFMVDSSVWCEWFCDGPFTRWSEPAAASRHARRLLSNLSAWRPVPQPAARRIGACTCHRQHVGIRPTAVAGRHRMSQHTGRSDADLSRTRLGMASPLDPLPPAPAPAQPARPDLRPGAPVGSGGRVFEAGGQDTGRLVQKLFPWAARCAAEVVGDFTRDALTVASLRHPHIAQVTEAGAR